MMGHVIPHLERALKDWRNHQSPKTLNQWALALQQAGFMDQDTIADIEAVLEAATSWGEWEMDDPLNAACEFVTAARVALIHDAMDKALHEAVAKALYDELFLTLGVYTLP